MIHRHRTSSGFTLLELLLSLALAAAVAALIGTLIQMFLINQNNGRDNVRQAQVARAILNMIAEDIRTTVRYQAFDSSGLQQLLAGSGGGSPGGGGGGGGIGGFSSGGAGIGSPSSSPGGGGSTNPSSSGPPGVGGGTSTASNSSGGSAGGLGGGQSGSMGGALGASAAGSGSSGSATGSGGGTSSSSGTTSSTTTLPPGVYGSSTSIEIDVSRLPRPDEYYPQPTNPLTGALGDMPSDIKTVGYFVQSPRSDGVLDPLAKLTEQMAPTGGTAPSANLGSGGLVRRSIDRAITQHAYEMGQSTQLMRSGEIISPEILAIEFQYFDGTMWQTQWDGSKQGLPYVIKITIALQRSSFSKSKPIAPGISISSLSTSMMQEYGIQVYSSNTIIPGSQLLLAPQSTTTGTTSGSSSGSSSGMSSVGL